MNNDFLSRWSRRKLRADVAPSQAPSSETPEELEPDQPVAGVEPQDGDVTPEELAALPALDELTAASDITGFLRKGVPAALRNGALRRVWALDPAIRDFVGDARDYAWDWNTPGGVPVSGPLPARMDVKKMVHDIFGRDPAKPAEVPEPAVEREEEIDHPADIETQESPIPEPSRTAEHAGFPEAPQEEPLESPPSVRPRRHGGALPG